MKLLAPLLFLSISITAMAQSSSETELRQLEREWNDAIVTKLPFS